MPRTIAVIDGNSLMHRAYHAVPPTMNAPDGTPTNAVFGFLSMLLKFIDVVHPDGIVCAFDAGKPAFRLEALEQYKAQRPHMDDELRVQFPLIEDVLASMGIPVVKVEGWEGDDILGTVSARCESHGDEVLLISGDKDVYQLASDKTRIVTTKKGLTDVAIYGPAEVYERYGVTAEQFPDYLGLRGDTSDNIPGVPGVGEKTAAKLLQEYGSIAGIYEHIDELKGKMKDNIAENEDLAYLSKRVATIVRDLDFPLDLDEVAFPAFDAEAVVAEFGKLGMRSHLNHILGYQGESADLAAPALDISWTPILEGADARALLDAAIADAGVDEVGDSAYVGVALAVPDQGSLFGNDIDLAVSCKEGTAIFHGDEAEAVLAELVAKAPLAALDVKDLLHTVYPSDTAKEAHVTDAQLHAMRAFDAGLAAYDLDSNGSNYTVEKLLDRYCGASVPAASNEDDPIEALAIQAACIRSLVAPLRAALEQDGSLAVFRDIDLPLIPVLMEMERAGAAIDVDRMAELGRSTQETLDELRAQIIEAAGEEFNIDSPKQLGHILFDALGLPAKKKTQTGFSTDAGVLEELSALHPLPGLVLKYRELAKIKSTYIDALPRLRQGDGRVHSTFNEKVTTTGRLSSSDPNLQNIPVRTDFGRQIRECFLPLREGEVFLSADYSQIELRLLAHLSGDEGLIAAFTEGADFHATTAARVFGVPLEEVTSTQRARAKAVNFGIVYGQQAFGLAQSLKISIGEAKDFIDRYYETYPRVKEYLAETVAAAKEKGYAETMFGRKRHIPELKQGNAARRAFGERTAMNHPMQGSAADIIKLAMRQVSEALLNDGSGATLLLQVHDELDFSVPAAEAEAFGERVKAIMENVVALRVPLIADVSYGENWAQAH